MSTKRRYFNWSISAKSEDDARVEAENLINGLGKEIYILGVHRQHPQLTDYTILLSNEPDE